MIMGVVLAGRHSAQIVGIFDDVWTNIPRHVGIRHDDGSFGDARGLHLSESEFLEGYPDNSTRIQPIAEAEVKRIWQGRVESWEVDPKILEFLGL